MQTQTFSHEAAVQEVYRLTPQIREYDEFMYLGVRWLPYTMFFHQANYQSTVINTDELGFRLSQYRDTQVSVARLPARTPVNILVGGSTTLGTGATSDAWTVASRLAAHSDEPWLNFGGRGYNAVQEVVMFLMHQHRFGKINNVVVFSGMNTLTLEGLPDELATEHGRYYYSYEYDHYMGKYNDDLKRRTNTYASELDKRNSLLSRMKQYIDDRFNDENPADKVIDDSTTDTAQRVQRAAWVVSNALKQWQQLLAPFNARLTFVLQPMAYWTRDFLTADEEAVFNAIDSCPNNFWRLFSQILGPENHAPFASAIEAECKRLGITFHDMNQMYRQSPLLSHTVFVDRVHFNDAGYDEAARLIHQNLY
ncbi:G-D-S-L family lipolytic protein [Pseudomonas sp. Irchel 3A7]|uniref:G-D-S-L family lipolytic protein n=1 Tax=Pseudomonas sp. Irchel 3A7 TaxID=2008913 RepID=UPI000BA3B09A|nr:G-D-S-L family lipolytic protein [Pseudomonas sp. Irchel 3A7]